MKKQKHNLNCTQAAKMIPDFINENLRYKDLDQFMEHIQNCGSCREELSIQFLVNIGLSSLEAGDTFDLQEELNEAMEDAYAKVRIYRFLQQSLLVVEIVGAAAVFVMLLLLLLWLL